METGETDGQRTDDGERHGLLEPLECGEHFRADIVFDNAANEDDCVGLLPDELLDDRRIRIGGQVGNIEEERVSIFACFLFSTGGEGGKVRIGQIREDEGNPPALPRELAASTFSRDLRLTLPPDMTRETVAIDTPDSFATS